MTAEPLKNCPFCGGKADMSLDDGGYYCKDCGCMPYVETTEEPADVWNRRVEPFGNSEEMPLWMKEEIEERIDLGDEELKHITPDQYPRDVYLDIKSGVMSYQHALRWVLSLKKPSDHQ